MRLLLNIKYLLVLFSMDVLKGIMPIENLSIMILKGRYICQRQGEKPHWKNEVRVLNTVLSIRKAKRAQPVLLMFRIVKSILGLRVSRGLFMKIICLNRIKIQLFEPYKSFFKHLFLRTITMVSREVDLLTR